MNRQSPGAIARCATIRLVDIAFIVDPLDRLKPYKDTSISMMRALARREHRVFAMQQGDLWWRGGETHASARRLTLGNTDEQWQRAGDAEAHKLADFDAVLMRKDPPFDMEYLYSTYLLEQAEAGGARVYNSPHAIRDNNEKMAIARFHDVIPPTLITRDTRLINAFIDEYRDVIVKPLDGMGGTSIFRVTAADVNRNVIVETVGEMGGRTIMVQRFIPEIVDGDKRIILIAGEVVPYSLARIPRAGETRGNLAAGGRGVAQPLTARDREIAAALGPVLWAEGLLVVGLDVIGPYLTEINVTSPTCFVEIAEQTGYDVAGQFAQALEAALAR